ncbi:MAG: class I SAM-dependent methyltransferase [Alphaproteobacteria bacterium]|nr:class I SAM-dependent methyltransferase [Alphaproteobacteria bacterium]
MTMNETCRLCGSKRLDIICRRIKSGIDANVLRCQDCCLVFLEDKFFEPKRIAELYQGSYQYVPSLDELVGTPHDPYKIKAERIAQYLDPAQTSLFEIGAGSGQFARVVRDRVKRLVCQEFNSDQADSLRQLYSAEVYTEGLEEIVLEDVFDVVVYLHVLEHIPDPLAWLRQTMSYVKPGGILYIEVPNVRDPLLSLYRVSGYDQMYFRQPHLFYYDQNTLRLMLERAGFKHMKIGVDQTYSLTNHLHWTDCKTPQPSLNVGYRFHMSGEFHGSPELRKDLESGFYAADARYRETLIRHGFGDLVYAIVENRP